MSSLTSDLLINPQDLYDLTVTTAATQLGALATTGDGRYYRYAQNGAVLMVPGKLQQAIPEVTGNENLAVAAAAIGATSVTTTSTVTVTANQYAGGYVVVTTTPGQGYMYQIGSHPAATSAVLTLTLVDPIIVALTTSSVIDLVVNPYAGIVVNPTTATANIVGVAVAALPINGFGWIQTRGVASVLAQGTITVGTEVGASSTTAGAVVATSGVLADVGVAVTGIASTEYGAVALSIG